MKLSRYIIKYLLGIKLEIIVYICFRTKIDHHPLQMEELLALLDFSYKCFKNLKLKILIKITNLLIIFILIPCQTFYKSNQLTLKNGKPTMKSGRPTIKSDNALKIKYTYKTRL